MEHATNKFVFCFSYTVSVQAPKKRNTALKRYRSGTAPTQLETVEISQILLCRMRGFCEWPAKVLLINDDDNIYVEFYGDHTFQWTNINNLFSFKDSAEIIMQNIKSKKRPLYAKSVKEAEVDLNIPSHLSLTKLCNKL